MQIQCSTSNKKQLCMLVLILRTKLLLPFRLIEFFHCSCSCRHKNNIIRIYIYFLSSSNTNLNGCTIAKLPDGELYIRQEMKNIGMLYF